MRAPFAQTKLCRGPAHPQPVRLPLTDQHWGFYRSGPRAGKAYGRCKLCRHWNRLKTKDGPHGLAPVGKLAPLAAELIDRCGSAERVERQHGLGASTVLAIAERRQQRVRLRTAQLLLLALAEQRRDDRLNGASERFRAAKLKQALLEERLGRLTGY